MLTPANVESVFGLPSGATEEMVASFDALVRATARVAREFRHLSQVLAARLDPATEWDRRRARRRARRSGKSFTIEHLFGRRVYVFPVSLVPVSFEPYGDAADGTTDGTDAKP